MTEELRLTSVNPLQNCGINEEEESGCKLWEELHRVVIRILIEEIDREAGQEADHVIIIDIIDIVLFVENVKAMPS